MSDTQNSNTPEPKSENAISDYFDGVKQLEMEGHQNGIRKARNALFITAGLFLIWEIIALGRAGVPLSLISPLYIAIIVVEVGAFTGLAFWTKTKPYTAIVVGIILFVLLWILAVAVSEDKAKAFVSGIIIRIAILVNLIGALKPSKAWEDLKKNS